MAVTGGKFFIDGNEIGIITNFTTTWDIKEFKDSTAPWNLIAIDKPWMFDNSVNFTGTLKIEWKNKIDRALGYTHYVKKGKLFRK